MTLQRKLLRSTATILLFLSFVLCHAHALNTTQSRNDTSVVTVHVLETNAPFATAYQIGTYKSRKGWSLIFSFKAHSPSSSTRGSSCFHVSSASGEDDSSSSDQAEFQVLKRVTDRYAELKNVFCGSPDADKSVGEEASNVVSYSEHYTTRASLVRPKPSAIDRFPFRQQFQFTALDVWEWQQLEDVVLVSQVAGQDIDSHNFGKCVTPLERQPDTFWPANKYATAKWLCVESVTRSAHEYWAMDDDKRSFVTDVKNIQFDLGKDVTKQCPPGYKPVIHGIVAPGPGQIDITMRLYVTAELFNVLCYKTSQLVDAVSGELLPSEKFLKQIKFNKSAELANAVNVEYNLKGLNLLPRATFTDAQVNAW